MTKKTPGQVMLITQVFIIQIPGISGFFKGIQDLQGVPQYGWVGYLYGVGYGVCGTLWTLGVMFAIESATDIRFFSK